MLDKLMKALKRDITKEIKKEIEKEEKKILGLVELVKIKDVGRWKTIMARIDTGAEISSMDEKLAKKLKLKPTGKHKIIKSASGVTKRPLLKGRIKIREQEFDTEVTIADRSRLRYQILIGQNTLKQGEFLIDPKINIERRKGRR